MGTDSGHAPFGSDACTTVRGRVVLFADCSIQAVNTLKAHMLEEFAKPAPYEIDGSAVDKIDTAVIQVLLAFVLDCLEQGRDFSWTGRSAVLQEAIRLTGVSVLLENPGVSPFSGLG